MEFSLADAYQACRKRCLQSGSNFVIAFRLLPAPKRDAMYALYAFHRTADDIGDSHEPGEIRLERVADLRRKLDAALAGDCQEPYLLAVADAVRRFEIPRPELTDVLSGVSDDIRGFSPNSLPSLKEYCRKVAGVVGQSCIRVWGFSHPSALVLAEQIGFAFQLTNILRDIREDAALGRCYLPLDLLEQNHFSVSALQSSDFPSNVDVGRFKNVVLQILEWGSEAYRAAPELEAILSTEGRPIFRSMVRTYYSLFQQLRRSPLAMLEKRVRVSRLKKLQIALLYAFPLQHRAFGSLA